MVILSDKIGWLVFPPSLSPNLRLYRINKSFYLNWKLVTTQNQCDIASNWSCPFSNQWLIEWKSILSKTTSTHTISKHPFKEIKSISDCIIILTYCCKHNKNNATKSEKYIIDFLMRAREWNTSDKNSKTPFTLRMRFIKLIIHFFSSFSLSRTVKRNNYLYTYLYCKKIKLF